MLSRPPEIPPPADGPTPEIGTPSRARYSTRQSPAGTTGRHRRAGSAPADKFLVEIPAPRRPTSLADSPSPYDADGRSTAGHRRARQPSAWDKASDAASHSLSIVVRALPAQRGGAPLPAARRLAGNVRDWALASPDGPPVTGVHRAPGTLPLESWLLIGRHRQQALLGALVAIGVMLVMVPGQRRPDDVTATNAADRSVATVGADGRATGTRPTGQAQGSSARPPRHGAPGQVTPPAPTDKPLPTPSRSLPAAAPVPADESASPAAPDPDATASGVSPDAHGPARSLRSTGTDAIALTFDDGPDPTTTPKLLKLLADNQVKATFCLVGERAQAHPELVQQIVAAGHTLCNHSWDHSFKLGSASVEAMRKDLGDTDKAIHAAVPDVPIPYFRAPGGIFTDRLVSVASETQKKSLYWGVDPRDWDHQDDKDDTAHIDRVIATVEKNVKPGSIILSHDFNQPDTITAYETLLPYLTGKYELGLP